MKQDIDNRDLHYLCRVRYRKLVNFGPPTKKNWNGGHHVVQCITFICILFYSIAHMRAPENARDVTWKHVSRTRARAGGARSRARPSVCVCVFVSVCLRGRSDLGRVSRDRSRAGCWLWWRQWRRRIQTGCWWCRWRTSGDSRSPWSCSCSSPRTAPGCTPPPPRTSANLQR